MKLTLAPDTDHDTITGLLRDLRGWTVDITTIAGSTFSGDLNGVVNSPNGPVVLVYDHTKIAGVGDYQVPISIIEEVVIL